MFLSHFEMKRGNIVVWSKKWSDTNCDVNLQDIELKSLPSGIHEVADDVINFVVSKYKGGGEDYYYGVAYFQQNGHTMAENSKNLDRSKVKMYSLGVVVNPNYKRNDTSNSGFYEWKPNQFTSANTYVSDLEDLLAHWFTKGEFENFEVFEKYFEANSLTNNITELASPVLQRSGKVAREFITPGKLTLDPVLENPGRRQMLEYLPYWIKILGPLVFTLYKSCLLGERILIMNPPGGSFESCNALNYCLSIISLIPKAVRASRQDDYYVRPLYTIGISDIEGMMSEFSGDFDDRKNKQGFIASTSDEILAYRTELYDKVLRLPSEFADQFNTQSPTITSNDDKPIKATHLEYELIGDVFKKYLHESISLWENVYSSEIEPMSWTQFILNGVHWLSTASSVKGSFHEEINQSEVTTGDIDNELETILNVVGYFHDKTANIFNKLKAIVTVAEDDECEEVICIPFTSLLEMDLDCFSLQDHDFVIALAQKWFQKTICISNDYLKAFC